MEHVAPPSAHDSAAVWAGGRQPLARRAPFRLLGTAAQAVPSFWHRRGTCVSDGSPGLRAHCNDSCSSSSSQSVLASLVNTGKRPDVIVDMKQIGGKSLYLQTSTPVPISRIVKYSCY